MKYAKDYADSYMATIRNMVAALDVDYDRLEELSDSIDELEPEELEELEYLQGSAQGCTSRDDAGGVIMGDALSVETRSGWEPAGNTLSPSEYRILLTTGGPHLEIRGELDHYGEPCRAWLVYSDLGTPYTERVNQDGDQDALLAYSHCFYFGE